MLGFQEILNALLNDWKLASTIFLVTVVFYFTKRDGRKSKFLETVPGPTPLPLFGNALMFLCAREEFMGKIISLYKQFGPVFKVWLGNQPFAVLCESSAVETILSSSVHIEKSREYDLLFKWLGLGLLTAKPKKWHGRRKLLTPTFHFKILEEFSPIFNEQASVFVNVLNTKADGKAFDIFPYVTRCALDIICETAMGRKLNAQLQKGGELEYVDAVYRYGDLLVQKVTRPWLQNSLVWKFCGNAAKETKYISTLHYFTKKVIADKKLERRTNVTAPDASNDVDEDVSQKKKKAFLDFLLDLADQNANSLTDTEIREEVDTFMFEGHDTTAASMVWTILCLSSHPEHQKLVQGELDGIFGLDKERNMTSTDISKMKYLECCIKEALRLYPSVPFYFRNLTEDVKIEKYTIPKGVSVAIADFLLHRDSTAFPDAEVFNPQRFSQENAVGRSAFSYVPFSAGPRNCIGQKFALLEEKTVLAKLFLNFSLQSVEDRNNVKMVPDIILRPFNGIVVKVLPRK